jgi:hypothetical protein
MADPPILLNGPQPFAKRHAHFFTFAGALIVFITFVVKDNLREEWKSTANAIEMAQNIYIIRITTSDERHRSIQTAESVADVRFAVLYHASRGGRQGRGRAYADAQSVEEDLDLDDAKIASIQMLIQVLPQDKVPHNDVAELRNQSKHIREELKQATALVSGNIPLGTRSKADVQAENERVKKSLAIIDTTDGEEETLSERLNNDLDTLTMRAELIRKQIAENAENARKWSIGLYVLGWGLALVGKLLCAEGLFGG